MRILSKNHLQIRLYSEPKKEIVSLFQCHSISYLFNIIKYVCNCIMIYIYLIIFK